MDREKGRAADKAAVDTAAGAAAAAVSAAAPVAAAAPEGLRPAPLPSHKSSRQILEIQLAAAVRNNCEFYVEYIDEMVLDAEANKLITKSSIGLRDMYVKAGINARAFRYVVFFAPAVFVVHQLATRPDVWGVLECLRVAFESLKEGSVTEGRQVPPLSLFKDLLLAKFPAWRAKYNKWEAKIGPYLQRVHGMATSAELWAYTAEILALSAEPSIASLLRNRDPDDKDNAALKNAQVVTGRVESGFGCLTQSLHDKIASLFAKTLVSR